MNGFGNWLRQFGAKLRAGFMKFMMGRYGTDKLNTAILTAGVIVILATIFVANPAVDLALINAARLGKITLEWS